MRVTDGGSMTEDLLKTPLNGMHRSKGARIVRFAGYEMPLHYPLGILKEHLHVRSAAGLFDVSHMGQVAIRPKSGNIEDAARAFETLVPVNVADLLEGRQRYALFTNAEGGILDDLIVANRGDHLFVVVNAACKAADIALMQAALGETCEIEVLDRALIALQGPLAEEVLIRLHPDAGRMRFMDVRALDFHGIPAVVSRSGYTGEDGYEISVPHDQGNDLAERILKHSEVELVGLGGRDSLRLEAGLCLYGQDIDRETTPVEAALEWAIQKVRRLGGARAGGFPGDAVILGQLEDGAPRRRVGLLPHGKAPVREGTELHAGKGGAPVGKVTSGGFGPSLNAPVAIGYVPTRYSARGTELLAKVRGKMLPVTVATMPFIEPGYKRG
jgi:aminomethyltransferase